MSDLFGNPAREDALTTTERRRLGKRVAAQPKGHAWAPGTGPAGETCGSCAHICQGRRWKKCWLTRSSWGHTRRTDVRARDPACAKWEKPPAATD